MPVMLGATAPSAWMLGGATVARAYLGAAMVYDDAVTPDPTYTPPEVFGDSTLVVRYDASTLTLADGAGVTGWAPAQKLADIPDGALTQATAAKQPTFTSVGTPMPSGLPVVHFDGTGDFLTAAITAPGYGRYANTMFAVLANVGNQAGGVLVDGHAYSPGGRVAIGGANATDGSGLWFMGNDVNPSSLHWGVSRPHEAPALYGGVLNGAGSFARFNGQQASTGTAQALSVIAGLSLGGRYNDVRHNSFDLAELIIYSHPLTLPQIEEIEAYLTAKWLLP